MPPSAAVMSLVRSGRLRALGHSLPQRTPLLPDIPAIAESMPGFKHVTFSGLLAPRGVPKPVLDRIRAHVDKIVSSPEVREQFGLQGAEPATGTPEEFRRAIQEELTEMGKLVKAIGLKAE
jgi:tripartite-type tricarboxylate transporter receptor subunit TctC